MLIRLVEYNFTNDESGLDNPRIIGAYEEPNFDKIIMFINGLINKSVRYNDDWYTIDTIVWKFPADEDSIPCLDIYCFEGI